MNYLVLTLVTLLALSAPVALAGTKTGQALPVTNRELVNSQTGAPIAGCPLVLRLTQNL